jgi:hypothetical protein
MPLVDELNYHLVETVHNFDKDTKPRLYSNYELVKSVIENNKIHFCFNRTKAYDEHLIEKFRLEEIKQRREDYLRQIRYQSDDFRLYRENKIKLKEKNERKRIKNKYSKIGRNNKKHFRENVLRELIEQVFHPGNIDKFEGWGF